MALSSGSRRHVGAHLFAEKLKVPRPMALARYIAMSVCRTSPSWSVSSQGYIEMPMLAARAWPGRPRLGFGHRGQHWSESMNAAFRQLHAPRHAA